MIAEIVAFEICIISFLAQCYIMTKIIFIGLVQGSLMLAKATFLWEIKTD